MKMIIYGINILFLTLAFTVCASKPASVSDELDIAIHDASDYLNENIPTGSKIVFLNVQSDSSTLSDYIIDEFIANMVRNRKYVVVDRQQLDIIRTEQNFQLSGEVADNQALEIGRFLGAQTIVSARTSIVGDRYRLSVRALNVQTAQVQGQYNHNIDTSETITALLKNNSNTAALSSAKVQTFISPMRRNPTQSIQTISNYHSPAIEGTVTFDYSNNNGRYSIGQNEQMFEIMFTKASDRSIYVYNDPPTISTIALVKDESNIRLIANADNYDTSSRTRTPNINQIIILKNINGFYAAIKIIEIKDDTRGAINDEVKFEYLIQVNGSSNFTNSTTVSIPSQIIPTVSNYHSPAIEGTVTFDYSNNNGRYSIGQNEQMFEIMFSKASDRSIYVINDPPTISTIALVKDITDIRLIANADNYDTSSRTRTPNVNQIIVLKNINGFYAAIKILEVKDDTRGAINDEVKFEYVIQVNGSSNFTKK